MKKRRIDEEKHYDSDFLEKFHYLCKIPNYSSKTKGDKCIFSKFSIATSMTISRRKPTFL